MHELPYGEVYQEPLWLATNERQYRAKQETILKMNYDMSSRQPEDLMGKVAAIHLDIPILHDDDDNR